MKKHTLPKKTLSIFSLLILSFILTSCQVTERSINSTAVADEYRIDDYTLTISLTEDNEAIIIEEQLVNINTDTPYYVRSFDTLLIDPKSLTVTINDEKFELSNNINDGAYFDEETNALYIAQPQSRFKLTNNYRLKNIIKTENSPSTLSLDPLPQDRKGRIKNIRITFHLPKDIATSNVSADLAIDSKPSNQSFIPNQKTVLFTAKNVHKEQDMLINLSWDSE